MFVNHVRQRQQAFGAAPGRGLAPADKGWSAASTAASTCAAVASAIDTISSPVAGLNTGTASPSPATNTVNQRLFCIALSCIVFYLMRWSLPPSRYYAEDRLSFGEPSWKTLRLLVSIWVRTLSIFIARIIGKAVYRKKFTRPKLIEFLATCPATTIAMEACGGSHFMARKLAELGHFPKLISPQFVRPFVKSNKNDFVDAEAICEAASRPSMRFVQPRTESQQAMRSASCP
jgi:hypothetical protein